MNTILMAGFCDVNIKTITNHYLFHPHSGITTYKNYGINKLKILLE